MIKSYMKLKIQVKNHISNLGYLSHDKAIEEMQNLAFINHQLS
jgi:hypothetical protein